MIIPKQIIRRRDEFLELLHLAIIFDEDDKRINYLQTQLNIIEEQIKNREEVNKDGNNI